MKAVPLVSIIIPAFNPRFFEATLHSALTQSHGAIEVVVGDDSSGTAIQAWVEAAEVPEGVSLRYLRNAQPLGFVGNLQRCLVEASGELVKVLCDDDRLFCDCIERQTRLLLANDTVSLVSAKHHLVDEHGHLLPARLENSVLCWSEAVFEGSDLLDFLSHRLLNFMGGFSSLLFRMADLRELLPVLSVPGHAFVARLDLALAICLLRRGHLAITERVLVMERLHDERLSKRPAMIQAAELENQWLAQMFSARESRALDFVGWVRYQVTSADSTLSGQWLRMLLPHVLKCTEAVQQSEVGSDCESFSQLYRQWLDCRRDPKVLHKLMRQSEYWPVRPRILAVVIDDGASSEALQVTLDSLEGQCFSAEAILLLSSSMAPALVDESVVHLPLVADGLQQLNGLLPQLDGIDWFYLLQAGDRLNEFTLMLLAERIVERQDMLCCYGDEGALEDGVSAEPVFKPDFNLDLLRSYPYVGRALAFERQACMAQGGFSSEFAELAPHDLLWRLVEAFGTQVVEHIPQVLLESPLAYATWLSSGQVIEQSPCLLEAHLERLGVAGHVRADSASVINRVDYFHAGQSLVSIVVPAQGTLPRLERCIASLLERTAYAHYEILLVDRSTPGSPLADWLRAMAQMGGDKLRVLDYAGADHLGALSNHAATWARGDYLLLLSPDVELLEPQWLDELLNHAQRGEVGIVGAKVLDHDGMVLHAGGVLGLRGLVGAVGVGSSMHAGGYMQRLQAVQNYSVVDEHCLLVRKALFEQVGGFDESVLTADLAAMDLSLRVRELGYLVVWTPYAQVVLDQAPDLPASIAPDHVQTLMADQQALSQRWMPIIARDPAYNPNLNLKGSSFCLEPGLRSGWAPFSRRTLPRVLTLPMSKGAVGHYRVIQPALELEAAGWVSEHQVFEIPDNIELERLTPDVVVIQGRYNESFVSEIERLKTYSKGFCVYELDDYIVKVPSKNAHLKYRADDVESSLRRGIARCDRVVVSTQPLADALDGMHGDIRVVPNMLAAQLWAGLQGRRRTSRKPRVGWGGGTSHTGDLEIITEVVKALASEVEWVFFGMCNQELRPYLHEFHPAVSMEAYPRKLASLNLDLALAPLEFHIFNDCKSNLRLLEYGACGYPVICSDTLAYKGYLPCTRVVSNTSEEWLEAIRMHLADTDASYRQGDQLREAVLRDYVLRGDNVQHWFNGWMPD